MGHRYGTKEYAKAERERQARSTTIEMLTTRLENHRYGVPLEIFSVKMKKEIRSNSRFEVSKGNGGTETIFLRQR